VSGVYQVRHRVLRERLEEIAAAAERAQDDDGVRLALCCLALLERHAVDGKGRCPYCCLSRRRLWRRSSRCTVLPLFSFYLEQPREFVLAAR
jgi:hypothetical protein